MKLAGFRTSPTRPREILQIQSNTNPFVSNPFQPTPDLFTLDFGISPTVTDTRMIPGDSSVYFVDSIEQVTPQENLYRNEFELQLRQYMNYNPLFENIDQQTREQWIDVAVDLHNTGIATQIQNSEGFFEDISEVFASIQAQTRAKEVALGMFCYNDSDRLQAYTALLQENVQYDMPDEIPILNYLLLLPQEDRNLMSEYYLAETSEQRERLIPQIEQRYIHHYRQQIFEYNGWQALNTEIQIARFNENRALIQYESIKNEHTIFLELIELLSNYLMVNNLFSDNENTYTGALSITLIKQRHSSKLITQINENDFSFLLTLNQQQLIQQIDLVVEEMQTLPRGQAELIQLYRVYMDMSLALSLARNNHISSVSLSGLLNPENSNTSEELSLMQLYIEQENLDNIYYDQPIQSFEDIYDILPIAIAPENLPEEIIYLLEQGGVWQDIINNDSDIILTRNFEEENIAGIYLPETSYIFVRLFSPDSSHRNSFNIASTIAHETSHVISNNNPDIPEILRQPMPEERRAILYTTNFQRTLVSRLLNNQTIFPNYEQLGYLSSQFYENLDKIYEANRVLGYGQHNYEIEEYSLPTRELLEQRGLNSPEELDLQTHPGFTSITFNPERLEQTLSDILLPHEYAIMEEIFTNILINGATIMYIDFTDQQYDSIDDLVTNTDIDFSIRELDSEANINRQEIELTDEQIYLMFITIGALNYYGDNINSRTELERTIIQSNFVSVINIAASNFSNLLFEYDNYIQTERFANQITATNPPIN